MAKPSIIYLCSEFPGISHTFVLREIEALEADGFRIATASVNKPQHLDKFSPAERKLAETTLVFKQTSRPKITRCVAALFFLHPAKALRMARAAWRFGFRGGVKNPKKALGYFLEAALLVRFARRQGIDHVHVHFANPAATVALIASRFGTLHYSLSVHGPDVFHDVTPNLLAEKAREATFVRCISFFSKSQLCRLLPYADWGKITIVRCGIRPEAFPARPAPDHTVKQLLCVGRLTRNKGQHVLMEACALLRDRNRLFHLTMAGDGEDRPSLEQLVHRLGLVHHVTFTGALGQDAVKALYRETDLFVLPSFAEGVPVVLMEAMAMEIPVISTRIAGIPELITSETDGLLVPPADARLLTEAILRLLDDPTLARRLGEQGRKKVLAQYHLDDNCRRLVSLFNSAGKNT